MTIEKEASAVFSETVGVASRADTEYRDALARVAGEAGVSPTELQKRVAQSADELQFTPECLTLAELERWPTFTALPKHRQTHVRKCLTCADFLAAITPAANERRTFVSSATSSARQRSKIAWKPALIGAAATLMIMVPIGSAYVYEQQRERAVNSAVLSSVLDQDRTDAARTGEQLGEAVRGYATVGEALRAFETKRDADARSVLDRELARIRIENYADASAVVSTKTAIPTKRNEDTVLAERFYLEIAQRRFAEVPSHPAIDVKVIQSEFDTLQEAAFESDSAVAWKGPYLTLQAHIKNLLRVLTSSDATNPTLSEHIANDSKADLILKLQLCEMFLEKFAAVRITRVELPIFESVAGATKPTSPWLPRR